MIRRMDDVVRELEEAFIVGKITQEQYEQQVRAMYGNTFRRFVLDRNVDVSGVSGTGVVAEGVEFSDGVVCMHWTSQWPSSVVFYEGLEGLLAVNGHDGRTVVRFLDGPTASDAVVEHTHDDGTTHAH